MNKFLENFGITEKRVFLISLFSILATFLSSSFLTPMLLLTSYRVSPRYFLLFQGLILISLASLPLFFLLHLFSVLTVIFFVRSYSQKNRLVLSATVSILVSFAVTAFGAFLFWKFFPEKFGSILEVIQQSQQNMFKNKKVQDVLPSFYIITLLIFPLLIAIMYEGKWTGFFKSSLKSLVPAKDLNSFSIPFYWIWALLLFFVLYLVNDFTLKEETFYALANGLLMNLLILFFFAYGLQGVAVIKVFFEVKKIQNIWMHIVFLSILLIAPFLFSFIGIADLWRDFRKSFK